MKPEDSGEMIIYSYKVFCIWNPITTTLTSLSQNTTCRDIYVWSFLNIFHPYPCPHTFFTSESSQHFLKLKKILCLFVYFCDGLWPLEMIRVCHHQHQHSVSHLCSCVRLVFHFRHTPRSREESWKATV